MPTCPAGHDTQSSDFCDVCGIRIGAGALAPAPAPAPDGTGAVAGQACPQCGNDRPGQFCEVCGYSFATGQPGPGQAAPGRVATAANYAVAPPAQAAGGWTAVVTADRAYFDRVAAAQGPGSGELQFPPDYP